MDIYSPDDCYVDQTFVTNGRVQKGDKLVQLVSPSLNEKMERLTMALQLLDIQMSQYTDGRSEANKQQQISILGKLEEEKTALRHVLGSDEESFKLGTKSLLDLLPERAQALDNQVAYIKQKIVVDHFDRERADAIDKLNVQKKHTEAQLTIAKAVIDSLLIVAPLDGHFETAALPGMFFQQGEIIGQYNTALMK